MILLKQLPDGSNPMTEGEFAKAFIVYSEDAGSAWSTLDVVRSWESYKKDPAGHFLSKPIIFNDPANHTQVEAA